MTLEKPTILNVYGLSHTSPEFRCALFKMCERNGWDVDDVAACISNESGFDPSAKNPNGSATGLIQFIDATAKALGLRSAAEFRGMSDLQQLPYVETYFQRALRNAPKPPRTADYYAALWGEGIGRDLDHVLARESDPRKLRGKKGPETENKYTLNRGLDFDRDGKITVGDLGHKLEKIKRNAGGVRLPACTGFQQVPTQPDTWHPPSNESMAPRRSLSSIVAWPAFFAAVIALGNRVGKGKLLGILITFVIGGVVAVAEAHGCSVPPSVTP